MIVPVNYDFNTKSITYNYMTLTTKVSLIITYRSFPASDDLESDKCKEQKLHRPDSDHDKDPLQAGFRNLDL